MLCLRSSGEAPRSSSDGSHPPEHLVVLANGILSDPQDWNHFKAQLLDEPGQNFLVYAEKDNVYCKTMGGVDVAGKRLARGVLEVVKQTPSLKKISFAGHSLGGLFVRYALALLYRPRRGQDLRGEKTRSESNVGTEMDQHLKQHKATSGSSKTDAEYTEVHQSGGATWRPSLSCSALNTNEAVGPPFDIDAPDCPPIGAGLDAPECRLIDSLVAKHETSKATYQGRILGSQPTKPGAQPSKSSLLLVDPISNRIESTGSRNAESTSQLSNPQPTEPSSQHANSNFQPTNPTPQPTKFTTDPTNLSPQFTNPIVDPTEPSFQPTIAGLEPCHLILVAVPHLGVWGRSQWPFARGVRSFERLASSFSGLCLGRTLRQLFLRDRGVAGEPLLLSMSRDCMERPFVSALGAFKTRHLYANVKWDAALGWKTSCVRLDADLDRVRKECFRRAEQKQWLGERYPYIVHVEDTPGIGVTGHGSFRGGALEYVFAPPLVRQLSDAVVTVWKGRGGGVTKGVALAEGMEQVSDCTGRTDSGTERTLEGTERTVKRTGRTAEGTETTDEGSSRSGGRTEGTHSGTERTVEGPERMVDRTGRADDRTERTDGGTKRTDNGTDATIQLTGRTHRETEQLVKRTEKTPDTRTAPTRIRTYRWSSEEACRALADRMVTGLHQVSWRKVDVLFHGAPGRNYAHQMLIMKDPRQEAAGQGVVNHMIDVLCGRI